MDSHKINNHQVNVLNKTYTPDQILDPCDYAMAYESANR